MHKKLKHSFLQACMNHSTLSLKLVDDILPPICDKYEVEKPSLPEIIKEINKDLEDQNLILALIYHPIAGEEYLVFGHTSENKVSQIQPNLSSADRHFFGQLLTVLINQPEYGIPWMEVYSVPMEPGHKPLTKQRIQGLLHQWSGQGYFLEKDNMLYFGPRMIVEYESYFKMNFADLVVDCVLCQKIVFWNVQCSECDTKVHDACMQKYLTRVSTCPTCKKTWKARQEEID